VVGAWSPPTGTPQTTDAGGGRWRLTWAGRTWTEDDLTGAHAALLTLMSSKDDWALLDPFAGPLTLMQILAAFIAAADRRDAIEVMGELGRLPIKQLLGAVSVD
jgi:hypothetical protein